MDQGGMPPIISEASGAESGSVSRRRWWMHLCVLTIFPLVPGVVGIINRHSNQPILPESVAGLLQASCVEVLFFALIFVIARSASRANGGQLLLRWRRGGLPLLLGFAYSFALRILVAIIVIPIVFVWLLLNGMNSAKLQQIRPQTGHLINVDIMLNNPLYLVLCLTLLSFVVGGLREELWRSAMLAGINALFPKRFATIAGKAMGVIFVAFLFGLGHTAQGIMGVGETAILGIGLGIIMLAHRSIWEAVIAHGFFDAGSFAALYVLAKYHPGILQGLWL